MTGWLAMLVVAVMLPFAIFAEPDPMATHVDENPPNFQVLQSPAYVFKTAPVIAGPDAEEMPVPMPTPLVMTPKLTPVDAQMRVWLEAAVAPEEYIAPLIAIGYCESRGNPEAIGDGGNSRGWLQLWTGWFSAAGYSLDQWSDPIVNAAVGIHVREVRGRFGGPGGWSCADHLGIY